MIPAAVRRSSLLLLLLLLLAPQAQASVTFTASTNNVSFGDVGTLSGLTNVTVFQIVKPSESADSRDLFGQYSSTESDKAIICFTHDTDEIGCYVTDGTTGFPSGYFARKTTDLNIASGTTYRIAVTVSFGGSPSMNIWVNGTNRTTTSIAAGSVTSMINSTAALKVGSTDLGNNALAGDYAEFAVWNRVLSNDEIAGLTSSNYPPSCYATGGLVYLPMLDTTDVDDEFGSLTATVTGGSNGTHPTMASCPGGAPIAFDAATDGGDNGGATTSLTFSHTTSGSDRFLVVGVVGDYVPNDTVTGCTYNAVAMTKSVTLTVSGDRHAYLFTLMAPASGANNVVCSASGTHYIAASAASYTGVSQTSQPEVTNSNSCTSCTTLSVSITTSTSGAWVAGVVKMTTGGGASVGTTERVSAGGNTYLLVDKNVAITPAGTTSLDVGFSTGNAAGAAAAFAPTGGGGGGGGGGGRMLLLGAGG